MRQAGILMPVASLPSNYGIGCFSKEAYDFVDFLSEAGQSLWQVLPLGPTSYGDSPYQSFSTYAGNPYFIDLETLIKDGLLTSTECAAFDWGSNPTCIDYELIYSSRFEILRAAYDRFVDKGLDKRREYKAFITDNKTWLPDYALFMAIKDRFGGGSYLDWDDDIRLRNLDALNAYREELSGEIAFVCWQQYEFNRQWQALKAYANEHGIRIVGDIPIYVAADSSDTWSHPELFLLDADRKPTAVAGCPPDAFSETGQLWGNPLYDWKYHRSTGYEWWINRIAHCFEWYDVLRVDHFRGFESYWSVPAGDTTAENGKWCKGPGFQLFKAVNNALGTRDIIAEDLGFITPQVRRLIERTGYPGMKVLQFAFDSREDSDYLPHNYEHRSVVYTGTHDNETTAGWYEGICKGDRRFARKYLNIPKGEPEPERYFIRAALASVSDTAVIPIQDWLGLGDEARINTPSTLGGNWVWRIASGACTRHLAGDIRKMTVLYGRLNKC